MRVVPTDIGLQADEPLLELLAAALEVSVEERQRYAVIVCCPQQMPGEDVSDLIEAAEPALREVLRADDISGRLNDDLLAVGVTGLTPDTARALAFRLKSDLRLHTAHVRPAVWEAGFASMPEDGATIEELVAKALHAAKHARVPA